MLLISIYLMHRRNLLERFRRMGPPEATLSYDEEGFTLKSEAGSATLPWKSVMDVWRFPRFWLLRYSRSQFTTLPLECLDASTQEFITRKTRKS